MKKIGCKICRQQDDSGKSQILFEKKLNAGCLGSFTQVTALWNYWEDFTAEGENVKNDSAELDFSVSMRPDHEDDDLDLFSEVIKIKYCPFCGADLKAVRNDVRKEFK